MPLAVGSSVSTEFDACLPQEFVSCDHHRDQAADLPKCCCRKASRSSLPHGRSDAMEFGNRQRRDEVRPGPA